MHTGYLRHKGFGYLQNSVWISPDPLAQEREILGGGKINVDWRRSARRGWARWRTTRCCRAGFCRRIIWGKRRGGGGWKCCATPPANCARSTPKKPARAASDA